MPGHLRYAFDDPTAAGTPRTVRTCRKRPGDIVQSSMTFPRACTLARGGQISETVTRQQVGQPALRQRQGDRFRVAGMLLLDDQSVDCEHEVTGSKSSLTYASGSAIKVTTKVAKKISRRRQGDRFRDWFGWLPSCLSPGSAVSGLAERYEAGWRPPSPTQGGDKPRGPRKLCLRRCRHAGPS